MDTNETSLPLTLLFRVLVEWMYNENCTANNREENKHWHKCNDFIWDHFCDSLYVCLYTFNVILIYWIYCWRSHSQIISRGGVLWSNLKPKSKYKSQVVKVISAPQKDISGLCNVIITNLYMYFHSKLLCQSWTL